jgi:hypothetical protein
VSAPSAAASGAAGPGATGAGDTCPLCQAPLRADQDWCLQCGAAARTRLAAPAKWKALALGLVGVALIALAVLAVALVKLTG